MVYAHSSGGRSYRFPDLKTLLAKASPARSGDALAGVAAERRRSASRRRWRWPMLPLRPSCNEALIPYEEDEVTRLIVDDHDAGGLRADRALDRRRFPRLAARAAGRRQQR